MIALVATADAHTGVVRERSHPELYDVATFGVAVIAVIVARRALRQRFAKRRNPPPAPPKD